MVINFLSIVTPLLSKASTKLALETDPNNLLPSPVLEAILISNPFSLSASF
jgi:hypothetical protein